MPTLTTPISGLDFLILPTQDKARAERFYCDVLDLELDSHWGEIAVEFKLSDDLTLALMDPAAMQQAFAAVTTGVIALRVTDFEASVSELQARGVQFEGDVIDSGACKMANFRDPDGNRLMIHQRYAP